MSSSISELSKKMVHHVLEYIPQDAWEPAANVSTVWNACIKEIAWERQPERNALRCIVNHFSIWLSDIEYASQKAALRTLLKTLAQTQSPETLAQILSYNLGERCHIQDDVIDSLKTVKPKDLLVALDVAYHCGSKEIFSLLPEIFPEDVLSDLHIAAFPTLHAAFAKQTTLTFFSRIGLDCMAPPTGRSIRAEGTSQVITLPFNEKHAFDSKLEQTMHSLTDQGRLTKAFSVALSHRTLLKAFVNDCIAKKHFSFITMLLLSGQFDASKMSFVVCQQLTKAMLKAGDELGAISLLQGMWEDERRDTLSAAEQFWICEQLTSLYCKIQDAREAILFLDTMLLCDELYESLLRAYKFPVCELLAQLHIEHGKIEDAITFVNTLRNPDLVDGFVQMRFGLLTQIVKKYAEAGQYKEALEFIKDQTGRKTLFPHTREPLLDMISDMAKAKDKLPEVEALRKEYNL